MRKEYINLLVSFQKKKSNKIYKLISPANSIGDIQILKKSN